MGYDVVIRGATVVDGTGQAGFIADVGVAGRKIVAIGALGEDVGASEILEASGCVVTPGFIDVHTHSDVTLLREGSGVNKICQGVTTEVIGNCGFSAFPLDRSREREHADLLAYLGPDEAELSWDNLAGYAEALQAARPIMNVACLVGHGTLRIAAMGMSDRGVSDEEGARLRWLLDEALEEGAFGFSSGLTYVPSMFGTMDEIVMLARIAAKHSAIYATHARATSEGSEAIEEAIAVGRASGVQVEYSHLAINHPSRWGQAEGYLALFEQAQQEGVEIQYDVYPYDASASSISQYMPAWLVKNGWERARRLLEESGLRAEAMADLSRGWYGGIPWLWDRVLVTDAPRDESVVVGHTLAELIELWGCDGEEVVLRLYERYGNALQVALFYRTEEDVRSFLAHPYSVVASDAVAVSREPALGRPHPRFYGTFPRVLGRYVLEGGVLSLEDAIRKMTGEPADRFGLRLRGYVREGYAADLVLLRPGEVRDRATFDHPTRLPSGIEMVWVNGAAAVYRGTWSGISGGEVLRRNG